MREFRYEKGHTNYRTMTVGELREHLEQYPDDMPVIPTWEGVCVGIKPSDFSVADNFHGGKEEDSCSVLQIDVDQY